YARDRFLAGHSVCSLLCIPILQQATLIGVLYLENDLVEGVFTHRRLALVKQLAAHMAISLTNARLYNRLNDARVAALAADRVKTRFLMNMSHELRTPLNAIIGFGEMIAENYREGDTDNLEGDLQNLLKGAYRLLRSVSSILELTQMETDAREVRLVAIDLQELLDGLVRHFEDAARMRDNVLHLDMPASLPELTSDAHMLRYILTTLIDNACRFSRGALISIRVAPVGPVLMGDQPWLEIAVADQGDGISPEELPMLFTAFYQVDDSPSRRYEGTGVSLAVAADFCRRLGGEISVESKLGEGSKFTVRIPQSLTAAGLVSGR
ncbi:MAG: GAF domain-containing sensor histidine kinase, partial [Nannocystaceae bacterium]